MVNVETGTVSRKSVITLLFRADAHLPMTWVVPKEYLGFQSHELLNVVESFGCLQGITNFG